MATCICNGLCRHTPTMYISTMNCARFGTQTQIARVNWHKCVLGHEGPSLKAGRDQHLTKMGLARALVSNLDKRDMLLLFASYPSPYHPVQHLSPSGHCWQIARVRCTCVLSLLSYTDISATGPLILKPVLCLEGPIEEEGFGPDIQTHVMISHKNYLRVIQSNLVSILQH